MSAGNPCIQCRVSPETKVRLHVIAEQHGITESALLKRFVDVALLQNAGTPGSNVSRQVHAIPRNARLFVRLRADDRVLLLERAAARGMAAATYARAGTALPFGELTHDITQPIEVRPDGSFVLQPVLFSSRVTETIEADFAIFAGAGTPAPKLPEVVAYVSGSTGIGIPPITLGTRGR
jgi:hypothetical protein